MSVLRSCAASIIEQAATARHYFELQMTEHKAGRRVLDSSTWPTFALEAAGSALRD